MSRHLNVLARQITKKVWKKLRAARKLQKLDTNNNTFTPDVITAITKDYHLAIEDATFGQHDLEAVINAIRKDFDDLCETSQLVSDALHGYYLNTIVLYAGDEITTGCYAGGMADFEGDEGRLYIAAGRLLEDTDASLHVGDGSHNVAVNFRSILAHEMGHLVMPQYETAIRKKFRILYDEQPKEYWEKTVSTYAGQDDHELFAESFAAWTHPDYKMGMLPQMIEDVLKHKDVDQDGLGKLAKIKAMSTSNETKKKRPGQGPVDIYTPDGDLFTSKSISEILDVVEEADWFMIEGDLTPAMIAAFEDAGYSELLTAGASTDSKMRDVVSSDAETYANEHGAELIEGLQDTTRDQLQGTIEDAIKEGWDSDELADEIENNFAFGDYRSEMIASNELAQAYSRGRITAAESAGAEKKVSLLSADHDADEGCDCTEAADAGEVDFDESFVEGDDDYDFPPYHVNCQCDWAGVYPEDEDEDEDEEDEEGDDEEHGKVLKRSDTFDGILPLNISTIPLTDEEIAANNAVQELSTAALKLATGIDGKRISSLANDATIAATTNETDTRTAAHQMAYDLHVNAADYYLEHDYNEPSEAHGDCAAAHKKIRDALLIEKRAIDAAAHEAATSTLNTLPEPSDAQKEAGNYQKGHIVVGGINIAIENPAGSKRKPQWPTLESHYGYINLTVGADNEHLDCFVRPGTDDAYNGNVYIIDQVNQDGTFDEHKIMIGWNSRQKAVDAYLANYKPGWKLGNVTRMNWAEFKAWLSNGDHSSALIL